MFAQTFVGALVVVVALVAWACGAPGWFVLIVAVVGAAAMALDKSC